MAEKNSLSVLSEYTQLEFMSFTKTIIYSYPLFIGLLPPLVIAPSCHIVKYEVNKLRCPQMGQIDNAILLMTVNRSGFTTGVFSD